MALNSGKILMRRGQEVNFDPNKMMPGEWAVSLDSKYVRMCFSPGVCIRMATYEAFEADMEQIREILAECQTVEEAVQRIYEEIKDAVVDVERIEAAAASALKSEENALNSANSAVQSANTATQKATEAAESANIASAKAEQATQGANTATEGASTATQKASEAAESADNVRNMSEVSQSYAVGGTGTRDGEDTDNAKYYNQQASGNADRAEEAAERASVVAGFGGTYTELRNKPTINDVELVGNKTLDELGIASKEALEETDNKVNIIIEKAELNIKETAIGENIRLNDSADSKFVEFALYGKATQNGTPPPENPVDIEVAGSNGSVEVKSVGKNKQNPDNILKGYPDASGTSKNAKFISNDTTRTMFFAVSEGIEYTVSLSKACDRNMIYFCNSIPTDLTSEQYYFHLKNETMKTEFSIVAPSEYKYCAIYLGTNFTQDETIQVQVEEGLVATEYQPYKEPTTALISTPEGLAGIPVDSGGNYTDQNGQQWICDEIVKYVDGSGEKIQRVGIIDSYSAETITGVYMSTTGELTEGAKILYQLAEPIRTPLTAEQLAEIEKLSTFYPVTNISNDFDCGMKVKYIADPKSYIDNRLNLIEQAILNSI